jgi:hypothetical protein
MSTSALLARLRAGTILNEDDREIVYEYALTKAGSSVVQKMIENAPFVDTDVAGAVLRVVQGRVAEVATSLFGVYLIEMILKLKGSKNAKCEQARDMVVTELLADKKTIMNCALNKR